MTEITYFTHLFGGWKSVEAYRYRNPDGSEGGIVAKSATVAEGVIIPADAIVWPDAKISLNVSIGDGASIGYGASIGNGASIGHRSSIGDGASIGDWVSIGNGASIGHRSSIGDGASIGDWVSIGNGASIGDWANLEAEDWLFVAGPQGSRNAFTTVIYSEKRGLRWWVGCQHGITTERLRERIAADHGDNDHAADYLYLIQTVENHPGLARKKAEIAARKGGSEA